MKTTRNLILSLLSATAIAAAFAAPAQAMVHTPDRAAIGNVLPAAGGRVIVIDAHTRWVNVTNGETVQFDVNGRRFTFTFDAGTNLNVVNLSAFAPADVMAPMVPVYIAPNLQSVG